MAIIKCKMCGGDLALLEGMSVAECEYCGSRQTVPLADNEKKLMLFARANRLRAACEFDKAAGIYEAIVAEFPQEAEAYWGLVLCKYGIEYVDDPATGKKIPTCHRSSFDSVLEDNNFDQAMENADEVALGIYRQEAKQIERIRRGILEVSSSERAYDIFICYKETDPQGNRTVDSLLAQDIYDALTARGYRVFFSRITLEDKLGQAYEPYIFAALNSAKIMLAVGTCYENYNAVWVKNEWSRYLKIISQDKGKYLIPCYKNIDAYDIPKEFAHLQGQDMGKVGAISDLLRGIEKLMPKEETLVIQSAQNVAIAPLLKRANMFLEDGVWNSADEYFEKVLNIDPENAHGYLGKLLAEYKIHRAEELGACTADFTASYNHQKARQFGDDGIQRILENADKDKIYYAARKLLEENTKSACQKSMAQLAAIPGWRDADELTATCQARCEEIEAARRKMQNKAAQGKQKSKVLPLAVGVIALVVMVSVLLMKPREQAEPVQMETEAVMMETEAITIDPQEAAYRKAVSLMEEEKYDEAINVFTQLTGYEDSEAQIENCRMEAALKEQYQHAEALAAEGETALSAIAFGKLAGYKDARERSMSLWQKLPRKTFDVDTGLAIGLKEDGTVAVAFAPVTNEEVKESQKRQLETISGWTDIVSVRSFTWTGLVGLKCDGTLVVAPYSDAHHVTKRIEPLLTLQDVVCLGGNVAVLADGSVYGANYTPEWQQEDISGWTDIKVADGTAGAHIVGIKNDGTAVTVNGCYICSSMNLSNWTDVVSVCTDNHHIAALRSDGTVLVKGFSDGRQLNAAKWTDIAAISVGSCHTVGLTWDGIVVAAGDNSKGQCNVSDWTDIVGIDAGGNYTAGLRADGTFLITGPEEAWLDEVRAWRDIQVP